MAFSDYKITTWTQPVVNEADRPKRSAQEMKAVFDSNSNQLKTAFNSLLDALDSSGVAGSLKLSDGRTIEAAIADAADDLETAVTALNASVSAAITTSEGYTDTKVAAAVETLNSAVSAAITTCEGYTDTEVAEAVETLNSAVSDAIAVCKAYTDQAVIDSGSADMTKAVYDPQGKAQDIFAYTDAKVTATTEALNSAIDAKAAKTVTFTVAVPADGWLSAGGGCYQLINVSGLVDSGHVFATVDLPSGTSIENYTAMQEAYNAVLAIEVIDGKVGLTCLEAPSTTFTLRLEVVG